MILPDGKKKPLRSRMPSREELALWRHVTADVTPRDVKILALEEVLPAAATPKPTTLKTTTLKTTTPLETSRKSLMSTAAVALAPGVAQPEPPRRREPPPLAPIEKKLRRHLTSGRQAIDDVLDLHGMTQVQAHHALIGFVQRAALSGAKVVLVVTGKGGAPEQGELFSERGVLRRAAPLWLREPALRSFVLSVEEASRPHGGAGALYVRLRRRRA